jgi:hypothetical protein
MDNSEMADVLGEAFCFAPAHGTETHDVWEDEQMKDLRQHYTSRDQVDYEFGDSHIPLSFSQIKTVEEGYQWMKSRYLQYPNEVLWCMAKAQFGSKETPKRRVGATKVETKAVEEAAKPAEFSIDHTEQTVAFD